MNFVTFGNGETAVLLQVLRSLLHMCYAMTKCVRECTFVLCTFVLHSACNCDVFWCALLSNSMSELICLLGIRLPVAST